jgi:GTP pyrophosphokinase
LQELEDEFGPTVRELVSGLHLLFHLNLNDRRRSVDDLRIMMVSVSEDVRVILLKLCLRHYCLEHVDHVHAAHRARTCRESLQLFAPVAARLGIYALKHRMEDRAFPLVYPNDAERILEQLANLHKEHGEFLKDTIRSVQQFLRTHNIHADVRGREKHPYSIFQKMQQKSITNVRQIHDLFAMRVIVPTVADCYQALGLIHTMGTPVSHRFKDYISFPKPNGYQSLHTFMFKLPNVPPSLGIEVQIRTGDMDREAEYGVAAHWNYKESSGSVQRALKSAHLKEVLRRQQYLLKNEHDAASSDDEMETFADHIYVLTPRGDIIELPDEATPLDFAFAIHTDIGLAFKAARVNGIIVPIAHKLENGDVVEILTHKEPKPTFGWIEEVRTSSARAKLKSYFASADRDKWIAEGRITLNGELRKRRLPPLDTDMTILKTFDGIAQNRHEREDLLAKIGMGAVRTSSIFKHIAIGDEARLPPSAKAQRKSRREHIVRVAGGTPMPLRFAKCCSADKGDFPPIVGFATRTGNVSVHRATCRMVKGVNPDRKIEVLWS